MLTTRTSQDSVDNLNATSPRHNVSGSPLDNSASSDNYRPAPVEHVNDEDDISEDVALLAMHVEELKQAGEFIKALKLARIKNKPLPDDVKKQLHDPPTTAPDLDDPILRLLLRIYLDEDECSEKHYDNVRAAVADFPGDINMLSHAQIKKKVQELSGVYVVYTNMCHQGCLGTQAPLLTLIGALRATNIVGISSSY